MVYLEIPEQPVVLEHQEQLVQPVSLELVELMEHQDFQDQTVTLDQ